MKFIDEDIYLEVSELNTENKVAFCMGEVLDEIHSSCMTLGGEQIIRLRDFLNEAINVLQNQ
jgi:hypothetical protein